MANMQTTHNYKEKYVSVNKKVSQSEIAKNMFGTSDKGISINNNVIEMSI